MKRQLVTLLMRSQGADTVGGAVGLTETLTEVIELWAAIGASRPVVHIGDTQVLQEVTHRMVLPFVDPTTWTHVTVNAGAQRFRKRESRDPDGRRRLLEVMLEEEIPET